MIEWWYSLRCRLRAWRRGTRFEQDLRDEVAFHLAMREDQLRASGDADAATRARRRFGNAALVREDLREAWTVAPRLAAASRDLRYAARSLRHSAGFTAVVVLTLGLGIGANTAFFSVVNAVLIRPLGFAQPDQLVTMLEGFPKAQVDRLPFSALDFDDVRRDQQSFTGVAAFRNVALELSGNGAPARIVGAKVSTGLFALLGVDPEVGRAFSIDDDRPGTAAAILSWSLWQRRYAGSPAVIGQTVQLDRQPYTVVGVMPARFAFPQRGPRFGGEPADIWLPIAFTDAERMERGAVHVNSVIGRLKPGVSIQAARSELDALGQRIAAAYPPAVRNAGFSPVIHAQPLREAVSGTLATPLLMLLAAVGLVLLVACANVANLLLSRMTMRAREFAVRAALGAGRAHLVRLLLGEGLILACASGVCGTAIAYVAVKTAPAVLTRNVPGLDDLAIDLRVLLFTIAISVATAIFFAVVPLRSLDRRAGDDPLRQESARATAQRRTLRLQRGLVRLTVSLACVLLVGAGLFMRSFMALVSTDVGFRPAGVLTASMTLPRTYYTNAASVRTFHDRLARNLVAMPGVRSVATATDLPLTSYEQRAFTPEGRRAADGGLLMTNLSWVQGPYFETLGMRLEGGRFFAPDEHTYVRRVVIVNERLAAQAWPGQEPVGRRLKWGGRESQAPWLTVVGVIHDVADGSVGVQPGVHAYEPFRQLPDFFFDGSPNQFGRDVKVALRADGDPAALTPSVWRTIASLDPDLAVESVEPLADQVGRDVAPQRFGLLLLGVFAGMALLLASIGLYGLLAFTTARRRREMAVRLALGAERRAVIGMVIAQGARLVGTGLAIGLLASLLAGRVVASLLYRTSPFDLLALTVIPAVLIPAALLACAIPAWRAARVDPAVVLRAE